MWRRDEEDYLSKEKKDKKVQGKRRVKKGFRKQQRLFRKTTAPQGCVGVAIGYL